MSSESIVDVQVFYGTKKISDVTVLLTNKLNHELVFSGVTNSEGNCNISLISDEDIIFGDYIVTVDCQEYSSNVNIFTVIDGTNDLVIYLVKLDDCQNQILTNKNCKYFHHEPYMTPNNFDLYFDVSQIPSNIIKEPPHELLLRLQGHMPLTSILHLNLETENENYSNSVNLYTGVKLNFNTKDMDLQEANLQITGTWVPYVESDSFCRKSYEVVYFYDNTVPLEGITIKLINSEYPLIQYIGKTDSNGKCSFNLPYGEYIQQFICDEYIHPPTWININQSEEFSKISLGIPAINYPIDFTEFKVKILNINDNTEGLTYDKGEVDSDFLVSYDNGECIWNDEHVEYTEGALLIYIGDIVDEVVLNASNNFTAYTGLLPLFSGDTKIYYMLSYENDLCSVVINDIDYIGLNRNEVVLL